jgi:hypothetical protein
MSKAETNRKKLLAMLTWEKRWSFLAAMIRSAGRFLVGNLYEDGSVRGSHLRELFFSAWLECHGASSLSGTMSARPGWPAMAATTCDSVKGAPWKFSTAPSVT